MNMHRLGFTWRKYPNIKIPISFSLFTGSTAKTTLFRNVTRNAQKEHVTTEQIFQNRIFLAMLLLLLDNNEKKKGNKTEC